MPEYSLKITDVCKVIGVKRWMIYYNIKHRNFPHPHRQNRKVVRWNEAEVLAWKAANIDA